MAESIVGRARKAWNAFFSRDPTGPNDGYGGTSYRPDRVRLSRGNERSIITSIYNRIAMDAANIQIKHVKLDEEGRYTDTVNSPLQTCLSLEANIDQTGRALIQDAVMTMLDEGVMALTPTDTDVDPNIVPMTGAFEVKALRVGRVTSWYPKHVRLSVYNEIKGQRQDVIMAKRAVAIVENPLYATMNEPNSVMQRLSRKLALLDAIDEQSSSGKLDLIIQLPYVVRGPARKAQAEERRKDLEDQLAGSKYGVAYTDGTEKIVQLNRSLENNLLKQIEFLTGVLYSQLGLTQEIMNGSADEATMLNYYNRTIEPIVSAIVDELKRKFLSQTARSQRQSIMFFRDPFKLVPVATLAELADKMTRNEIMTSNEIRQVIGLKPSKDPSADELRNKNLNQEAGAVDNKPDPKTEPDEEGD